LNRTIRFQITGEKHIIAGQSDKEGDDTFIFVTKCKQRCVFGTVGKLPVEPPKTNCGVCYGKSG
jgi:hypothetical protein